MELTPNIRLHRHAAMGTEFLLYLDPAQLDEADERTLVQAVFAEVDRVEGLFSRFRPASEISRINRLAAQGPVVTDPEVFSLLFEARTLWQSTGGAFDIALGRLSRAWGFAEKSPHLPDPEKLAQARAASGMAQVALDPEWRTVEFLAPGLELDLGAFAKGYAVDCALQILRANGTAALIDAGHSSLAATGEPFASGWPIEVQSPPFPGCPAQTLARVQLHTNAMGSSGIMEQKLEQGGQTFPHLFDPRSPRLGPCGQTVSARLLQATVLAPSAALADALSTALFVLGPVEGAAVLAGFPAVSALWIVVEDGQPRAIRHQWPVSCA
jgi:thiamine biosynthesis lipoprotein